MLTCLWEYRIFFLRNKYNFTNNVESFILYSRILEKSVSKKSLKIPKGGNQNLSLEEVQTTQCPQDTKGR